MRNPLAGLSPSNLAAFWRTLTLQARRSHSFVFAIHVLYIGSMLGAVGIVAGSRLLVRTPISVAEQTYPGESSREQLDDLKFKVEQNANEAKLRHSYTTLEFESLKARLGVLEVERQTDHDMVVSMAAQFHGVLYGIMALVGIAVLRGILDIIGIPKSWAKKVD